MGLDHEKDLERKTFGSLDPQEMLVKLKLTSLTSRALILAAVRQKSPRSSIEDGLRESREHRALLKP